ncbi:MAG TPA: hypothetical protein EYG79_09995 [Rhodobacteraceae bacterium]|nr:hypothetical protein [Paracoccaceae bacterium]
MSASITRGGGFLVGVIYGLIASTALYLVLCYLFPINLVSAPMESAANGAPVVLDAVSTSAAPEAGAQPLAPDVSAPELTQPDAGANDSITVGGAGDSGPAPTVSTQIAGTQAVNEPEVATAPAGVPDIGNSTPETAAPGADTTVPITTTEVASTVTLAAPPELGSGISGPAIEVFATAFTGDTSKPMMAIVLEDTLESSLQPLVDAGVPISFAVPANIDNSITAQSIRGAGFEVVVLIPEGVSRTEGVAENIARFMQNVPVAVAIMDANPPALMLNRDSMQAVIEASRSSGLGLITFAKNGELVARSQAEEAGVLFGSALQISDDFQDEELIIQALNQAAFVAGTNDRAIIFAKTRPSTINALLRWLQSARAGQVEIVPVSVVLQRPSN